MLSISGFSFLAGIPLLGGLLGLYRFLTDDFRLNHLVIVLDNYIIFIVDLVRAQANLRRIRLLTLHQLLDVRVDLGRFLRVISAS